MSVEIQDKAEAAVRAYLDEYGQGYDELLSLEDEMRLLGPAAAIRGFMGFEANSKCSDIAHESGKEWRSRLDALLENAETDLSAYLSCAELIETLPLDGIPVPPGLGRFAARVIRGEVKSPSKRNQPKKGKPTQDLIIRGCVNLAAAYGLPQYGDSSRAISAVEVVSWCLEDYGFYNERREPLTTEAIIKIIQRNK